MKYLKKLPGSFREQPGLERIILSKLPQAFLACTLLPVLFYFLVSNYPTLFSEAAPDKAAAQAFITTVATILTFWTIIFTVALCSFIVYVMKGHAYVADAYPLIDSDKPIPESDTDETGSLTRRHGEDKD